MSVNIDTLLARFDALATRSPEAACQQLIADLQQADVSAAQWQQLLSALLARGWAGLAAHVGEQPLHHHAQACELRYLWGNALRLHDQPHAAERELRAVLSAEPQHRNAALSLAFLLREQGRIQAAAQVIL